MNNSNYKPLYKSKKSAFTFAELMISLVIIAVITALLYPTISEITPNNNKQLFRSAYKTIELVVSEISANNDDISSGATPNDNREKLCKAFKDRLNTAPFTVGNNGYQGCEEASNYTLYTSNGMRWYFANYDSASKTHTIYVDVNASNNKTASQRASEVVQVEDPDNPGNMINQDRDKDGNGGPTSIWPNGCFRVENQTVKDTFKIGINTNGKISIQDSIGSEHLKDTTE